MKGACLDVTSDGVSDLTQSLCASNVVKLKHLVDGMRPGLAHTRAVASTLGL